MTWNNQYTPQFQQPQYGQPQQGYAPQEEPTAPAPSFGQLLKSGGGKAAFNKDSMPFQRKKSGNWSGSRNDISNRN